MFEKTLRVLRLVRCIELAVVFFFIASILMQNTQVLARLANAGCICAGIAGQKNRSERERGNQLSRFVNIWMVLDLHWIN